MKTLFYMANYFLTPCALQLIVEYLALLPSWKRERIEKGTRYFHALLEADADGDLVIDHEDWHGKLSLV